MNISEKKMVTLTYDLYVSADGDEKQELMESATVEKPLTYCHGIGMMLSKFESNIAGLTSGETFDFTIAKEDAYGEYDDAHLLDLPRNIFEIDGKFDDNVVFVGNVVPLMDNEGNRINAQVTAITEEAVSVDLNHPLAGEDLHFIGKVIEVRDATEKELNSYLGMGGGCGCGSGGCGSGCESEDEMDGCGSGGCGCSH
jgi:FKBP-type peptidyl-prolyl cis-trans isomerase SlyD